MDSSVTTYKSEASALSLSPLLCGSAMDRKCSLCGKLGHNSRTCTNFRGIKLFGVWLHISSSAIAMEKSFILDSMKLSPSPSSSLASSIISFDDNSHAVSFRRHSDTLANGALRESTKGRQWTKEEHEAFLKGLEKLGKGDWRGISRSYVKTRTSTQVASHAQKFFLRKKRRSTSLFDLVERKNKAVHPPLLSTIFSSQEDFSSAENTSSPIYGPNLELTLNTNRSIQKSM